MPSSSIAARRMPIAVHQALAILHRARAVGRSTTARGLAAETMGETISRVVDLLRDSGASWALVGAHAIGCYTEPWATVAFEIVVDETRLTGVCRLMEAALGDLDVVDMGSALRLRNLDVDLIRSGAHPLFQEALRRADERDGWRIPRPEVLVALKLLSAVSPWRGRAKQRYDSADIRALVTAVGIDALDRALMVELAAQVYPGAESEFESHLEAVERGAPITF